MAKRRRKSSDATEATGSAVSLDTFLPQEGERAFIAGQTGSGKTSFACWMLTRLEFTPIVIYDAKLERKFDTLPNSRLVSTVGECAEAVDDPEIDHIVFRPPVSMTHDPYQLDNLLWEHYNNFDRVAAFVDEMYMFQVAGNARAGRGLRSLITRGRGRGITLMLSAQRPVWVDMFAITESQRFYLFRLAWKEDRKKLSGVIEDFDTLPVIKPKTNMFYYAEQGEPPRLFNRVEIDKALDVGYTDAPVEAPSDDSDAPEPTVKRKRRPSPIWL